MVTLSQKQIKMIHDYVFYLTNDHSALTISYDQVTGTPILSWSHPLIEENGLNKMLDKLEINKEFVTFQH